MTLIDLDDRISWEKIYFGFVKKDPLWSTFKNTIASGSDDDLFRILREIQKSDEYVSSEKYLQLKNRCYENFLENYTHVAAYHACRPIDKNSYLNNGINPANTDELINIAKELFNDSNAVDAAVQEIKDDKRVDYIGYGSAKIWFFISRTRALVDRQYVESGSELIQSIARRLGDWAIQTLSKVGAPTIFQCSIPISWLNESIARIYSVSALTQFLICKRKLDDIDNTIDGAFCIEHFLPKEHILKAIDVTSLY